MYLYLKSVNQCFPLIVNVRVTCVKPSLSLTCYNANAVITRRAGDNYTYDFHNRVISYSVEVIV